jgi:type I restriction enzyme, S subunit
VSSEELWGLPASWCWTTLAVVSEPIATIDPRRHLQNEIISYVDLSALHDGKIETPQTLLGQAAPLRARQIVRAGDTLFSGVRVYLRNIALVEDQPQAQVASTAFCVLRPSEAVEPRYIFHYVKSQKFVSGLIPLQRGNSPPAVVDADVKAQPLPLPPLSEQRRIVEQIDALFAEIVEGEAALAKARKGLDLFRRSLLKAAITGELTRDWRATNKVTKTAAELLAELASRRQADASARRSLRRFDNTAPLDRTALPEIPNDWLWAKLGFLTAAGPTNGYSPKKSADGSGSLALKLTATTQGRIDLSDKAVKMVSETIPAGSDLFLKDGDLLFQRGNTIEYVGIAAIYEGPQDRYIYPDLMIRVRAEPRALTDWLWRVSNSPYGRKYMSKNATGTAGTMPKISGEILRNFPIPLPPPREIWEILRLISDALVAAEEVQQQLDAEAADAVRLKQSILKAAFEGRLVPQDPRDEPATALLERIALTSRPPRRRGRPTRELEPT